MIAIWVISIVLAQSTVPADATMDWLLDQPATSQPSPTSEAKTPATTQATESPQSPFAEKSQAGQRNGRVAMSDGSIREGMIFTTPGKPIRVWDETEKVYHDLAMELIAKVESRILWERDEPEWRFKSSGQDEKIFTGKTYPAREVEYRFTLADGATVTGQVVAPIYVKKGEETTQFVLNKRSKGEVGKKLGDLVYIKSITLDPLKSEK